VKIALILATIGALRAAAVAQPSPSPEDLYAEGQRAFDRGDYAAAIAKWQASYDLSGADGLLFNLAQARRLSGDCPGALATYRRFVAADPSSEQRPLAEDLARELEAACGAATPVAALPKMSAATPSEAPPGPVGAPAPHDDRRSGHALRLTGLATSGAGAALLVTGVVLGHHGQTLGDEVTAACTASCDWSAQRDKDSAGRRDASIGYALDAVGVAGIAGGAIAYYLGVRGVAVAPRPREGGAIFSWSGAW